MTPNNKQNNKYEVISMKYPSKYSILPKTWLIEVDEECKNPRYSPERKIMSVENNAKTITNSIFACKNSLIFKPLIIFDRIVRKLNSLVTMIMTMIPNTIFMKYLELATKVMFCHMSGKLKTTALKILNLDGSPDFSAM
jgi:hypothetical protein